MAESMIMGAEKIKTLTDDERLDLVGKLYVDRNIATAIFTIIDRMRKRAKVLDEPKSLMLIGDSGMGKTTLLKTYLARNPSSMVNNCIVRPVLYVSIPVKTTMNGAATALLRALEVPGAGKGVLVDRTHLVIKQLEIQKVDVVLVDETQHVVEASGPTTLPRVGDFFKDISKKAKVPFVLTGMPNTTRIFDENPQLKRLCRLENIGPFTAKTDEEFMAFRRFLTAVDKQLPFTNIARLSDPQLARLIFVATQGKICNVMTLIREASILAIENGHDPVTDEHLMQAFDNELDSIVPVANNPFDPVFKKEALNTVGPQAA